MNYFELLNLKQIYDLDQSLIKKQYLLKQVEYHPDRTRDESQKRQYIEKSMLINEAYQVLTDECKRAEYLLKLNGYEINDKNTNQVLKFEDLESIIEQNEIIDETEDLLLLQSKEEEKTKEKDVLVLELTNAFESNNFLKALDLTIRLKYLTNLVRNIKTKIRYANNRN